MTRRTIAALAIAPLAVLAAAAAGSGPARPSQAAPRAGTASTAPVPPAASDTSVRWWRSSEDLADRLTPQPDLRLVPIVQPDSAAVVVDDASAYQSVLGMGSSLEHSTCYNLSLLPPAGKPVVLTAAMRPATSLSSDGPLNLLQAACVALHPGAAQQGVLVASNGLILAGNLTLGGGSEEVSNAVDLAELAAEKGAQTLLLPVSARRQLLDVSDEVATRVSFLFYADPRDALIKALAD